MTINDIILLSCWRVFRFVMLATEQKPIKTRISYLWRNDAQLV